MPSPEPDNSQDDPRLNEHVARYLLAVESGQPVDREQYLIEHSEYADELREFFADKSRLDELAGRGKPDSDDSRRHAVELEFSPLDRQRGLRGSTLFSKLRYT